MTCRPPPGFLRCLAHVYRGMTSARCSRKAVVGDYCRQHDPEKVKARRDASNARTEKVLAAIRAEADRDNRRAQGLERCRVVILGIADGAADPRTLAKSVVQAYPELFPEVPT
jgi:hypothetical protein